MYVLVDMEWISNQHGNHWPTQLAAARVDAQWNTVDTFSVLFRPRDFSLQRRSPPSSIRPSPPWG